MFDVAKYLTVKTIENKEIILPIIGIITRFAKDENTEKKLIKESRFDYHNNKI